MARCSTLSVKSQPPSLYLQYYYYYVRGSNSRGIGSELRLVVGLWTRSRIGQWQKEQCSRKVNELKGSASEPRFSFASESWTLGSLLGTVLHWAGLSLQRDSLRSTPNPSRTHTHASFTCTMTKKRCCFPPKYIPFC